MKKQFENDLTQGSVAKQLIKFALPFIISNLIQSLYAVADMIIVGNFSGSASMNGVTQGSQMTMLITNAVIGLSVGGTVLIGQYLGAGRRQQLKDAIGTLLTTLMVLSVVITAVTLVFRRPLMDMMNVPAGEVYDEALSYFTVTMCGTLFIFGYNALAAIMRGMGDSKTPLTFVGVACVFNVGLDILLVGPFGMKAFGAAIATVVSQAVSMILCIIYLRRNKFVFNFNLSSFGFNKHELGLLFKIGFPTMLNNITIGISFTFILALVNGISDVAGSAVGAVGRINAFAILPGIAVSSAVSAMAAQNIGAGMQERASRTMRIGMLMTIAISGVIFALTQLFPEFFLRLFLDGADPNYDAYIATGIGYIRSFSFDYLIVPFQFCLNGLFIGAGYTNFALFNGMLSSLLIRIPSSYFFGMTLGMGISGVGLGAPSASLIACIVSVIFYATGKWKKQRILINHDLENIA
jgi:putative MATE family efflux protein